MKKQMVLWMFLVLCLVCCGRDGVDSQQSAVSSQQSTVNSQRSTVNEEPSVTATSQPTNTPTNQPTHTPSALPSPLSPLPSPTNQLTLQPTPTPTPNPYAPLTIEALAERPYGGGLLDIVDTLEETETFTRYLITYPSDGLTIYGYMNVPHEGTKFPVAIVLHGYIDPAVYETVAYTRRYADSLAEAGYFVIHPNFRNYPPSDSGPDPYRIGYATDVLNLIAVIREQSQDPVGYLRRADADNIHLWGHSMGGGVALRVVTVNNADYIKAAANSPSPTAVSTARNAGTTSSTETAVITCTGFV